MSFLEARTHVLPLLSRKLSLGTTGSGCVRLFHLYNRSLRYRGKSNASERLVYRAIDLITYRRQILRHNLPIVLPCLDPRQRQLLSNMNVSSGSSSKPVFLTFFSFKFLHVDLVPRLAVHNVTAPRKSLCYSKAVAYHALVCEFAGRHGLRTRFHQLPQK